MIAQHPLAEAMAERGIRQAHLLWHASREQWDKLSAAEQQSFVSRFGPKCVPPRRSLNIRDEVIQGDGAGRDFLWMHRQMIAHANHILAHHGLPLVSGWPSLPGVGDTTYAVPRGGVGDLLPGKDDARWRLWLEDAKRFDDADYLRRVTIDEMGTQIEYGVHAAAHQRFGKFNEDLGPRYDTPLAKPVDPKWDVPAYDSLLDPYAAHVHPWFWKLHGWIDARITGWERANNETVDWQGAWSGVMEDTGSKIEAATLEAMVSFFNGTGIGVGFYPRLLTQPPDRPDRS